MRSIEWAAGLFEGEGCISAQKHMLASGEVRSYPVLVLTMTDEDPVRDFAAVMEDGVVHGPILKGGTNIKPVWYWRVSSANALRSLARLFPHLGQRRRGRALEVLAAYAERSF